MSVQIDRTSPKGVRYVADEDAMKMQMFCICKGIPVAWIRFKEHGQRYYLKLKGRWANA